LALEINGEENLYAVHNGKKFLIHYTHNYNDQSIWDTTYAYFALYLNPGDSIKINSGSCRIWLGRMQAEFIGFLLKKKETSQTPDTS
jgi:hypothetical protein